MSKIILNPIKYVSIEGNCSISGGKGRPTIGNMPITIDILIKDGRKS